HPEGGRLYFWLFDRHERCASAHQNHKQICEPRQRDHGLAAGKPARVAPIRWRGRNSARSGRNGFGHSFDVARCFIGTRGEKAKNRRRTARLRLVDLCHGLEIKRDRKSTRLNSSHEWISYAVFCLKKKKKIQH